ncbi:MAG: gamma-glutamyl-gamma-aminobutyrate hydrolase family protein [Thermoleophilia bacterium]
MSAEDPLRAGPALIGITTGARLADESTWDMIYGSWDCVRAVEAAGGLPLLLPVVEQQATRAALVCTIDGLIMSGEIAGPGGLPSSWTRARADAATGGDSIPAPDVPDPAALPGLRDQNPRRYDSERGYLLAALGRGLPVVGICRGHQVLAETLGGRVANLAPPSEAAGEGVQHHQGNEPASAVGHLVDVSGGRHLATVVGEGRVWVNSFHRQAVVEAPPGFAVVGIAPDGVIEAIEAVDPVERVDPNGPRQGTEGRGAGGVGTCMVLGMQFHPETLRDQCWAGLFERFVRAALAERARR